MIKPIETYYNGYRFRSRLEARWAVFFDEIGVRYEYEPEGLVLSDGGHYLPDFYLPQFSSYFEVKRSSCKGTADGDEAIRKIRDGSYTDSWSGMICFGDPYDHDITIYCQEMDDGGGGSYEGRVVFGYWPCTTDPMLFSWDDFRDRDFFSTFCDGNNIPMITDIGHKYIDNPFFTKKILDAEIKARQARFEHGENGAPA